MADETPGAPTGLPASEPVVVPSMPEQVYDLWLIEALSTSGTGLGADKIRLYARLRRWDGANGLCPPLPGDGHLATVTHPDLLALAGERPDVAAAIAGLVAALVGYAGEQGVL